MNPDIQVMTTFTGDFEDPIKAKEAAVSQMESGADVLVYFVDAGMTGVIAAAEEELQRDIRYGPSEKEATSMSWPRM